MNRFLTLSVVCVALWAHGAAAQLPPVFLTKWGTSGNLDGQFAFPIGVAVDAAGNVYVADAFNDRIQKFDSNGSFLLKWGTSGNADNEFAFPAGVAVDAAGNVYVADTFNYRIQKFDSNGNFLLKWGTLGTADGQFDVPHGVAVDAAGNVYVVEEDDNHRIQKFDSNGNFLLKWGTEGGADGQFAFPIGVAVDAAGNVYVADTGNDRIQKFDSNGNFLLKWGTLGTADGQFAEPGRVAVDAAGNVYVADTVNNRIQKFDSNGNFLLKWGTVGGADGQFNGPFGVAVDAAGNVYVADTSNHRIQKFGCPPCPPLPPIERANFRLGEPVFVNATEFDVSVFVDTPDRIQFSQFTVDYQSGCVTFVDAFPGGDLSGNAQALLINDSGSTASFPVNNPGSDRHVLVQATTTDVDDAYGPGCGLEIVKLRFEASATPPANCYLAWDFSDRPNPPSQLVTILPAQVRPTVIRFCDLLQLCTQRGVTGKVSYFRSYPNGTGINGATVQDISANPTDTSDPNYTLTYPPGGGNVTLTASLGAVATDQDAVTGFDLILALRHVAIAVVLTADQQIAADVNRNSMVDGNDALRIANWLAKNPGAACNPATPGATNCTATWRFQFDPENLAVKDQITFPLACVIETINLKGFFLGDVDGFWPNPFKPNMPSRVDLDLQVVERTAESVVVGLLAGVEAEAFESIVFSLVYDGAALRYAGMVPGTQAADDLFIVDNGTEPGVLHGVAASWRAPSTESGELLRFRFDLLGPAPSAPITFARLQVNDRSAADVPVLDVGSGDSSTQPNLALPKRFTLGANPNPFNPNTRITYTIPAGTAPVPVQLAVYDITGRLVRSLLTTTSGPGFHEALWNGRDDAGSTARSGLYLVRIRAGNWTDVQKVSLLK